MTNENEKPVEKLAKPEYEGEPSRTAPKDDTSEAERSDPLPQYDSFMRIIRR